jgi:large exoprotein involved in heme utilization and adhesion
VILADAGQIASTTEGAGSAGDIVVEARTLTMNGGAQIFNDSFGNGLAGSVSVTAKESIAISGSRSNGLPSAVTIFALGGGDPGQLSISAPTILLDGGIIGAPAIPNGLGRAGDITVVSGALTLTNGGRIDSTTFTDKPAGIVTVIATDSVVISGHSPSGLLSGIVSGTTGAGDAGKVVLSAPTASVILSDDALIGVSTLGSGSAGSIEMEVGSLTLGGGAQISSATFGNGLGGVVTVRATDSITISGRDSLGNPSGLFTNTGSTGHGGNIELHARQIQLADGAIISAKSFGTGNAGNISIVPSDRLVVRDS